MTEVKSIPQFENEVVITGEVLKSTLEKKTFNGKNGNPDYEAITGKITLKTSENETHTCWMFVKETTSKGNPNKIFKNVSTVLEGLVTIEDLADEPEDSTKKATKLRVSGEMDLNEYYQEDVFKSSLQPKAVFLNRIKSEEEYNPKATFDVEGIVLSVLDETKQDEETGRKILKVLIPTYNSALPLDFIVKEGGDAEYVEDNFEVGSTVNIFGDIINYSEKIVTLIPSEGFGEDREKLTFKNKRELILRGGNVFDEEHNKTLQIQQIKELNAKRNKYLAELKEKSENGTSTSEKTEKKIGFGSNGKKDKPKGNKPDISSMF